MAGRVRGKVWNAGYRTTAITPDLCPVRDEMSSYPNCLVADLGANHVNLCPFAYRFELRVGGSGYDVMTIDASLQWLASQDVHGAQWYTLCLRKESKGTEAGARLRS